MSDGNLLICFEFDVPADELRHADFQPLVEALKKHIRPAPIMTYVAVNEASDRILAAIQAERNPGE